MLPENITAIVTRNEEWTGEAASEPFEAGWAREAVIFVRALKSPVGVQPQASVEVSPDGRFWLPEGSRIALPEAKDALAMARISHFGNWLRLRASFPDGSASTLLVTIHLKA